MKQGRRISANEDCRTESSLNCAGEQRSAAGAPPPLRLERRQRHLLQRRTHGGSGGLAAAGAGAVRRGVDQAEPRVRAHPQFGIRRDGCSGASTPTQSST